MSSERYYNRRNRFFDDIHLLSPNEEQWDGYDVPLIIIDNYLKTIAVRHNWMENRGISYREFSNRLNKIGIFNTSHNCKVFHVRIDDIAKQWCNSKGPKCEDCPLSDILV